MGLAALTPQTEAPTNVMFLGTPAALEATKREARAAQAVAYLELALRGGFDRNVTHWRSSYHADDPANTADMWVYEGRETLWAKRDDHPNQNPGGACSWCGTNHEGWLAVITVMLPAEY